MFRFLAVFAAGCGAMDFSRQQEQEKWIDYVSSEQFIKDFQQTPLRDEVLTIKKHLDLYIDTARFYKRTAETRPDRCYGYLHVAADGTKRMHIGFSGYEAIEIISDETIRSDYTPIRSEDITHKFKPWAHLKPTGFIQIIGSHIEYFQLHDYNEEEGIMYMRAWDKHFQWSELDFPLAWLPLFEVIHY